MSSSYFFGGVGKEGVWNVIQLLISFQLTHLGDFFSSSSSCVVGKEVWNVMLLN